MNKHWPENWIEPELRDDKSPFFKELENALTQSEITPATAENAFVAYVEKLDDVARLEVCGVYREREVDDQGRPTGMFCTWWRGLAGRRGLIFIANA